MGGSPEEAPTWHQELCLQRTVRRPQGRRCDIGAFEFALPRIRITTPRNGARYKRGSRVKADYRCSEGGVVSPTPSPIASCTGTVPNGHRIDTNNVDSSPTAFPIVIVAGVLVTSNGAGAGIAKGEQRRGVGPAS